MKIVVLDGGTLNPGDISWSAIDEFGSLEIYQNSNDSQIIERAQHAEIIIVNKVLISKEIIDQLPKLKYIAVSATGYNNVDVQYCNLKGILVSNVINYGSDNVAQHVFALILALTNKVESHYNAVKNGKWQEKAAFTFWESPIIELSSKTIGIIGFGNIGSKVAKIADGFNMNVLIHSQSKRENSIGRFTNLDELLTKSDFVSLNTHLSEDNFQMVDENFLSKMKSSAYLINTSRGGLIQENDLAKALKNNVIAGAGLDVLSTEPPSHHHPLIGLDNCIVTPHNAWASIEARKRLMAILVENIHSYLRGQPNNLIKE